MRESQPEHLPFFGGSQNATEQPSIREFYLSSRGQKQGLQQDVVTEVKGILGASISSRTGRSKQRIGRKDSEQRRAHDLPDNRTV